MVTNVTVLEPGPLGGSYTSMIDDPELSWLQANGYKVVSTWTDYECIACGEIGRATGKSDVIVLRSGDEFGCVAASGSHEWK